jgi:Protein of unknown function (DUF1687)
MFRFVSADHYVFSTNPITNAVQSKTLDVITLFHQAKSPASIRVASLLKQASAAAASVATEDQASDYTSQMQKRTEEFELNITEDPPTVDQVRTILDYVGQDKISSIFKGVQTKDAALKKFSTNPDTFQRPVVR